MKQAKKTTVLSFLVLLVCLILSSSQLQASGVNSGGKDFLGVESSANKFSLLDPQRLKMSHSYTFSYFSNSRTSGSFGVYTTAIKYQVSDPLSLTLNLNYLHQPLSVFGQNNLRVEQSILPNFQLYYKPSNSFSLWINVLTWPPPSYMRDERLWWMR